MSDETPLKRARPALMLAVALSFALYRGPNTTAWAWDDGPGPLQEEAQNDGPQREHIRQAGDQPWSFSAYWAGWSGISWDLWTEAQQHPRPDPDARAGGCGGDCYTSHRMPDGDTWWRIIPEVQRRPGDSIPFRDDGGAVEPTSGATPDSPRLSAYWSDAVKRWEALIVQHADKRGIDPDLIAAIMTVESNGNPNATSPSGAVGLMQVMPYHATSFPTRPAASSLYDPSTNMAWGTGILASNLDWAGGNVHTALMAYYDGPSRALNPLPRTRAYAEKVLGLYRAAGGES